MQPRLSSNPNPDEKTRKFFAGCAAFGSAFLVIPLCAMLVIGPLFILPMLRGTQSARPKTELDRFIESMIPVSPSSTSTTVPFSGVPIANITPVVTTIATPIVTAVRVENSATPSVITVYPTATSTMVATTQKQTVESTSTPQATPTALPTSTPQPRPTVTPTAAPRVLARVTTVINGETIEVLIGNTKRRVRYIGITAPTGRQCYAASATSANRTLVNGQTVSLQALNQNTDSAGNLLRLVYLNNGKLINEELLTRGAARVQSASLNNDLVVRFTNAQQKAVTARTGLWSACAQSRP
jgi:micrococcal nuclease